MGLIFRPLNPRLIYLAYIASAVVPAALAIFLVKYCFQADLSSFVPTWNDEIDYWHEILSFAQNGFSSGYYTIEEIPSALSSVTRFGTHGPLFPMLYGSVAKFVGWIPSSGPIFNLCALSIAITIFLLLIRANLYTILLATITFVSFWPIQIYLPSTMQESTHYAIAMVLAGQFYRYIADEKKSKWLLITIPILLFIASLLRPTWSVLFIPYFILIFRDTPQSKIQIWILGVATLGTFFYAFTLYASPYPNNFISHFFIVLNSSPTEAVKYFAIHFSSNLVSYFSLQNPLYIEEFLRLQFVITVVFGVIIYPRFQEFKSGQFESVIHIFNLIAPLAIVISLYDVGDWRDCRVLAPHVLFSIALLLAQRKVFFCMLIFAVSLLSIPSFFEAYKQLHESHFLNKEKNVALLQDGVFSVIKYKKDGTPWGNSLLIDMDSLQSFIVSVPAGIGINAVLDWNRIQYPLKSAYIFLRPGIYQHISDKVHFQTIASSVLGTLYLNLDSPANQKEQAKNL